VNSTATLLCTFLTLLLAACSTVPETGRVQLSLFNDEQMAQMGAEAYDEACKGHRIVTGTPEAQMVERIGRKIAAAAAETPGSPARGYAWEFRLLEAPEVVNAFCLPGGKVAVYSGILKVTQNEDALAAVVGHEVAHATSHHGDERVSQSQVAEILLGGAGAFVGMSGLSAESQQTVMGLLSGGANLAVLLPYSRKQESEADEVGLLFLVRAGYDAEQAPLLWERMAKLSGESDPVSSFVQKFTSTHPDPLERAQRLRELVPVMRQRVADERAKR